MTPRAALAFFLLAGLAGCSRSPIGVPAAAGPDARAALAEPVILDQDSPVTIVEKAIAALGGPEKLARWNAGRVTYRASGAALGPFLGQSILEDTFQLPGHFKRVVRAKAGDAVYVVNHGSGWQKKPDGIVTAIGNNPRTDQTGHLIVTFIDVTQLLNDASSLSMAGSTKDTVIVRDSRDPDKQVDWHFDLSSGLPVRSVQTWLYTPALTSDCYLADYKEFGGGKVPTHITCHQQGTVLMDITIRDVRFVEKWDESVFAKP